MMISKGKKLTAAIGCACLLVVITAVFALRGWFSDEWYIAMLKHGDENTRRTAVMELEPHSERAAIALFIVAGCDNSELVRGCAQGALIIPGYQRIVGRAFEKIMTLEDSALEKRAVRAHVADLQKSLKTFQVTEFPTEVKSASDLLQLHEKLNEVFRQIPSLSGSAGGNPAPR